MEMTTPIRIKTYYDVFEIEFIDKHAHRQSRAYVHILVLFLFISQSENLLAVFIYACNKYRGSCTSRGGHVCIYCKVSVSCDLLASARCERLVAEACSDEVQGLTLITTFI